MTQRLFDAQAALAAPFKEGEEQYRVGPTWTQGNERFTRPLAYIDARAVFGRLDEVVGPDGWESSLERLAPGVYRCRLTVLGVSREDIGMAGASESEAEKAAASDAIKRAAVQFGIGRYLYARELSPVRLEPRGSEWVLPRGWRPGSEPQPEPQAGTIRMNAPTQAQLDLVGRLIAQLGWDSEQGRAFLLERFAKRSRSELTRAEASACIEALKGLTQAS